MSHRIPTGPTSSGPISSGPVPSGPVPTGPARRTPLAGRAAGVLAATALTAAGLAVAAPLPAAAAPTGSGLSAAATEGIGGHRAKAVATPLSLLLFEERIRITTSPEGEADLAYTEASSTTGPSGRAVASWLWPGPLVGDGLGIVTAGAGLPATEYPVSAKSTYPTGGTTENDLGPGLQQRAHTDEQGMLARVAIDPLGAAGGSGEGSEGSGDPDGGSEQDGGSGGGLPGLPTLSGGASASSGAPDRAAAAEPDPTAALFDVDAVGSRSEITYGATDVVTEAVSRLGGVDLIAGLVHVDAVTSRLTTSSDGTKATSTGGTKVVGLEVRGTPVAIGDEGVRVAGEKADSPGSEELRAQLDRLGLRLWLVPAERTVDEAAGSATASGLVVEVDTRVLRSQIDTGALDDAFGQLPPKVGTQLQLALRLAPRLVFRLGYAESSTAGSPQMEIPDLALPTPPAATDDSATGGTGSSGAPGTGGVAGTGTSPSLPPPAAGAAAGDVSETPVALAAGPGLPPLYSIPGLLLFGGFVLAGAVGTYVQKLGGAALGGARPCMHGNESGVPDLRKV